ncbi:MAG: sulfurtransferase complex subunit TusB [Thermoplasmata archaeon]|jgi:sulfur relay protein TusB/DsrH|nr:sulfurtransferase complex subunit TusB [Thermoplasmata archaeon]
MTRTAFLVLKSPQEQDPTHMIKRLSEKEDASVILVEDGVYQALTPAPADRLSKATSHILVSREDLEARGFTPAELRTGKAAEYADIVDLIMEKTERTVTI